MCAVHICLRRARVYFNAGLYGPAAARPAGERPKRFSRMAVVDIQLGDPLAIDVCK